MGLARPTWRFLPRFRSVAKPVYRTTVTSSLVICHDYHQITGVADNLSLPPSLSLSRSRAASEASSTGNLRQLDASGSIRFCMERNNIRYPRSRAVTIYNAQGEHSHVGDVHRAARIHGEVCGYVSILSLFKCVCRIILTSRTHQRR